MRVIKFMGKKSQRLFRAKIGEIEPIGGSAVGSYEERQKVFNYLNYKVRGR